MSETIYRAEALERLGSPEQIDRLVSLTSPRSWLALAALGLVLGAGLLWAVFGSLQTTVQGQGLVSRPGGTWAVETPGPGVVAAVPARPGAEVAAGEELLRLVPAGAGAGGEVVLTSPGPARVMEVLVREGAPVAARAPLVTLESLSHPARVVLFLPAGDGYRVRPGADARVFLGSARDGRAGVLAGRVLSAGRHPVGRAALRAALRDDDWVNGLLRAGPCLEVVIELTGGAGSDARPELYSGTPCQVLITIGRQRPVELLLPARGGSAGV